MCYAAIDNFYKVAIRQQNKTQYMTEIYRSVEVVLLSLCKKSLTLMLRSRGETKIVTFVVA